MQPNQKNWGLPIDAYFQKVYLGQPQLSSSSLVSKLDFDYQIKNESIVLKTKNKIFYDNMDAYWKVIKVDQDADGFKYELKENYLPVSSSKTQDNDLASNSTIQTDLPEIKVIAANIKGANNKNRTEDIQGILNYLASNYVYDHEMADRNVVRPLTTKEALDRKKGVCQHYAVLFTAISRALNIPSRIITGFSIRGDRIGYHAWVEVEIAPNQWQVVEPQSKEGLTQTLTRFFFPLARANFLEDKDAQISADYMSQMIGNTFEFSKVDSN